MISGLLLLTACNNGVPANGTPTITAGSNSQLTIPPTLEPGVSPTPTPEPTATPTPTPSPTPTLAPTPTGTAGDVCFSEADHYFSEDVTIELSIAKGKDGYITYTTDGKEPTKNSTKYTEPLVLSANDGRFPNCYSIRAKAFYDDGSESKTYVHNYFVNTDIDSRYTTVVFAINGDPAELTEGPDGILYGENYSDRGMDSERMVHIEALTADGELLLNQFAGVRVFGGTSRKHAIKSLKLFARKDYGKGSFAANFFNSTMIDGETLIEKYDKLVLRNTGDDFQLCFLRDEMNQRIAVTAGFEIYEGVIPAIAYLNGSYYGYYWLHESYCNKYFQNKYGKSEGEYVILEGSETGKGSGNDEMERKAAADYNSLYRKYAYSDLTNEDNYQALCARLDVENYLDYMAYNMYIANYDWPQGNYRVFRYFAAEATEDTEAEEYAESGVRDGRWRFLLHDMDIGFGCYQSSADSGAIRNDIKDVIFTPTHTRYAPLLAHLVKRTDCRDYFLNKLAEYMYGALSYENVDAVLTQCCAERDPEMVYYLEYLTELSKTTSGLWSSQSTIDKHLARIRNFAKLRPEYLTKYIEECFKVDFSEYTKKYTETTVEDDETAEGTESSEGAESANDTE